VSDMTAEAGYEYFEAEPAVGIRAWAPDRARAFAESARGVFARIIEPSTVADHECREVRAQGGSPEELLANWISEGLYVHEIEGFAVHTVEVTVCTGALVHGFLRGEPFDDDRHRPRVMSRSATRPRAAVIEAQGRIETTLVIDI